MTDTLSHERQLKVGEPLRGADPGSWRAHSWQQSSPCAAGTRLVLATPRVRLVLVLPPENVLGYAANSRCEVSGPA